MPFGITKQPPEIGCKHTRLGVKGYWIMAQSTDVRSGERTSHFKAWLSDGLGENVSTKQVLQLESVGNLGPVTIWALWLPG